MHVLAVEMKELWLKVDKRCKRHDGIRNTGIKTELKVHSLHDEISGMNRNNRKKMHVGQNITRRFYGQNETNQISSPNLVLCIIGMK